LKIKANVSLSKKKLNASIVVDTNMAAVTTGIHVMMVIRKATVTSPKAITNFKMIFIKIMLALTIELFLKILGNNLRMTVSQAPAH
jgi:hypothetical protein